MFDISFGELAVLAVIALLVVGPDKLPELARTAGKWYGAARRAFMGVKSEVEQQLLLDELRRESVKLRDLGGEDIFAPSKQAAADTAESAPPAEAPAAQAAPLPEGPTAGPALNTETPPRERLH